MSMEEIRQHLESHAHKAEQWAAHLDREAVKHQEKVAISRAEAGQYRAMAEEFRRLAAGYDAPAAPQAEEVWIAIEDAKPHQISTISGACTSIVGGRVVQHIHVRMDQLTPEQKVRYLVGS